MATSLPSHAWANSLHLVLCSSSLWSSPLSSGAVAVVVEDMLSFPGTVEVEAEEAAQLILDYMKKRK